MERILSKLPRLLDVFARRLQVQERLTEQVARAIQQAIEPRGVAVRLEAAHFCMMMRGVEKQESVTLTASFLGAFDRDLALRQEFYSALGAGRRPPEISRREGDGRAALAIPPTLPTPSGRGARVEPRPQPDRIGVFTGESAPVPRGKYPRRVGPRPGMHRR